MFSGTAFATWSPRSASPSMWPRASATCAPWPGFSLKQPGCFALFFCLLLLAFWHSLLNNIYTYICVCTDYCMSLSIYIYVLPGQSYITPMAGAILRNSALGSWSSSVTCCLTIIPAGGSIFPKTLAQEDPTSADFRSCQRHGFCDRCYGPHAVCSCCCGRFP